MALRIVATFPAGQLEEVCRTLGEAMSGSQMDRLLAEAGVDDVSGQSTKWKRLFYSLEKRQQRDGNANAVCAFIKVALAPARFGGDREGFADHRDRLNVTLAFAGLELRSDGKLYRTAPASTLDEAHKRANALRERLKARNVHPDVLTFCRAELLQENYFHAVFEATKSVADKIRVRTGLGLDGALLVDQAFTLSEMKPPLAFNRLETEPEQSEHKGLAMLIKGMFGTFRNTTAHAPRVSWPIELDDALDLLTLASLLHRRLDASTVTPWAPINQR